VLSLTGGGALEPKNPVYTWAVGVCRNVIFPPPAGLGVQFGERRTHQAAYTAFANGSPTQCTLGSLFGAISGVKTIRSADRAVPESWQMSSCLELVRRR